MQTVVSNPGGTIKVENVNGAFPGGSNIFTCPAGKRRVPLAFIADFTTVATVGNRSINIRIAGVGGTNWIGATMAALAASQVGGYDIAFAPGTVNTTVRRNIADSANTNVQVREFCPYLQMKAGDYITVVDSAAIAATDTVNAFFSFVEYDV